MAQSFLGPNSGSLVRDALAPVLVNEAALAASQDDAWVEVQRVGAVAWFAETGTVTGTSVVCDIEIQGADDASGTNLVSYGKFATITEADDDAVRVLETMVFKPYVRASTVVSGTTPVIPVTVKGRQIHDRRSDARTA